MTESRALVDPRKIAYVPFHLDTHGVFALEYYGRCTPETRAWAKTIRFAALYGMPSRRLSTSFEQE